MPFRLASYRSRLGGCDEAFLPHGPLHGDRSAYKDIPARYQTTVVETSEGKTYHGIIIYEAVDGLILQTGSATTVRVPGSKIAGRHVSQSLMPAGLLDPLSDQDIVDLYAYLREAMSSK